MPTASIVGYVRVGTCDDRQTLPRGPQACSSIVCWSSSDGRRWRDNATRPSTPQSKPRGEPLNTTSHSQSTERLSTSEDIWRGAAWRPAGLTGNLLSCTSLCTSYIRGWNILTVLLSNGQYTLNMFY